MKERNVTRHEPRMKKQCNQLFRAKYIYSIKSNRKINTVMAKTTITTK